MADENEKVMSNVGQRLMQLFQEKVNREMESIAHSIANNDGIDLNEWQIFMPEGVYRRRTPITEKAQPLEIAK